MICVVSVLVLVVLVCVVWVRVAPVCVVSVLAFCSAGPGFCSSCLVSLVCVWGEVWLSSNTMLGVCDGSPSGVCPCAPCGICAGGLFCSWSLFWGALGSMVYEELSCAAARCTAMA